MRSDRSGGATQPKPKPKDGPVQSRALSVRERGSRRGVRDGGRGISGERHVSGCYSAAHDVFHMQAGGRQATGWLVVVVVVVTLSVCRPRVGGPACVTVRQWTWECVILGGGRRGARGVRKARNEGRSSEGVQNEGKRQGRRWVWCYYEQDCRARAAWNETGEGGPRGRGVGCEGSPGEPEGSLGRETWGGVEG